MSDSEILAVDTRMQEQTGFKLVNPGKKVYGDDAFELMTTGGNGEGAVTYKVPENNQVLVVNGVTATIIGSGEVVITATKEADDNYYEAEASLLVTVNKKKLTITAVDKTMVARGEKPIFEFTVDGLVYGETISEVTYDDSSADTTKAGTYSIVPQGGIVSGRGNGNYDISYEAGSLVVQNNSGGSDGSSSNNTGSGVVVEDEKKGIINSVTGIVTGSGSGYSNWQQETTPNGTVAWKLQYADGSYAAGSKGAGGAGGAGAGGATTEVLCWELVNGAWYPFGADGFVKSGFVFDSALNGTFYIDINTGMKTGWVLIDGKWYYFNPNSDGTRGIMFVGRESLDGYYLKEDGSWDEGERRQ